MTLNAYAAQKRLAIFERLRAGLPPEGGTYSEAVWAEGKVKGAPQMGATRYEPWAIHVEFIFPDPKTTATVLVVTLPVPERIVFMPVPAWVVESIWQGEISGTAHFESEARRLHEAFGRELEEEPNRAHFGPRQATHRE